MGSKKPNNGEQSRQMIEKMRAVHKDWLAGGYGTSHDLALRHGVADSTICKYLKMIREWTIDDAGDEMMADKERRIKQFEMNAGRALQGWKSTKEAKFLTEYRNSISEICRLRGHYPEKKTARWTQYQEEVVVKGGKMEGVPADLVIKAKMAMLEVRQSANGSGQVLNVESRENEDE